MKLLDIHLYFCLGSPLCSSYRVVPFDSCSKTIHSDPHYSIIFLSIRTVLLHRGCPPGSFLIIFAVAVCFRWRIVCFMWRIVCFRWRIALFKGAMWSLGVTSLIKWERNLSPFILLCLITFYFLCLALSGMYAAFTSFIGLGGGVGGMEVCQSCSSWGLIAFFMSAAMEELRVLLWEPFWGQELCRSFDFFFLRFWFEHFWWYFLISVGIVFPEEDSLII